MKKQQILNHFKNGDVVECLWTKRIMIFDEQKISIQNYHWVLGNKDKYIIIQDGEQLARIIQHDKTEVYAQLGKEVEVILNEWCNDCEAGVRIRKLYGK